MTFMPQNILQRWKRRRQCRCCGRRAARFVGWKRRLQEKYDISLTDIQPFLLFQISSSGRFMSCTSSSALRTTLLLCVPLLGVMLSLFGVRGWSEKWQGRRREILFGHGQVRNCETKRPQPRDILSQQHASILT